MSFLKSLLYLERIDILFYFTMRKSESVYILLEERDKNLWKILSFYVHKKQDVSQIIKYMIQGN